MSKNRKRIANNNKYKHGINNTRNFKKFQDNSKMLMTLALYSVNSQDCRHLIYCPRSLDLLHI